MAIHQGGEQDLANVTVIHAGSGDIAVADAHLLFNGEFVRSGSDLIISGADGNTIIIVGYFNTGGPANLVSPNGAMLTGDIVDTLAGPLAPGQYAQAGASQGGPAPIGTVVTVTGSAAATRADGTLVTLIEGAPVFAGDVVQTAAGSSLGLTFLDGTVFNMADAARMVLNNLVYQEGGSNNAMLFSLVQGGFSFFAGQIAPTGDMKVTTPVTTIGIRGTSPFVLVSSDGSIEASILPDPITNLVGSYTLFSLITGQPIGTVSQTGSKWTLETPAGTPQVLAKSADELINDQAIQQQLTSTFSSAQTINQDGQDGGGGDGQDSGDDNSGTDQEGTLVPEAGPEGATQVASSGFAGDEKVIEAQEESIQEPSNSETIEPQNTGALGGSGALGSTGTSSTGSALLTETSDSFTPPEPTPAATTTSPPPAPPEAPTIILPSSPTIVEDTSIVLTGFDIQDTNNTPLAVAITALSTVTLASIAGLTFSAGDGVDDEFMAFTGSAEDINNALNGLIYNPTTDNDIVGGIDISVSNGQAIASSSLRIEITATNDAPVAVGDLAAAIEDVPLNNIAVLANDFDVDGDPLTVTSATALNGTVAINPDNTLNYTPDADFTGLDTITYEVSDGNGETGTATVTVTVAGVNDPPLANDDAASTNEDVSLSNIVVLANDTDIDGDALTVTGATALNGTVAVNADNTLNYTPNSDFNGADTIVYDISDGNGGTDAGAVNVTVIAVNDNPIANDDAASTDEDVALNNIVVLANDTDADAEPLTVISASAVNGTVIVNANGTLNYTPDADFNGNDIISYTVLDGSSATDTATVAVTVNPVNDPPVANDDVAVTDEDMPLSSIVVLANDTDIDGGPLALTGATALNGMVTVNPDGTLNYTPDADFNGTDAITYTVSDGNGGSDTGTVTVTVNPVNDAPVADNETGITDEDTALTNIDVLTGDTDVDGDPLTVLTASALNGSVGINLDGTLDYTPNANFTGNDTITYSVIDSGSATDTATVAVTVNPINDAPVVDQGVAGQFVVANSTLNFLVPGDAFLDVDMGDSLSLAATLVDGAPLPSWLNFNGSSFTGTPTALDGGTISIEVTATDTSGLTSATTFDLSVTPTILGTTGDDKLLVGTSGGDFIDGLAGNDTIEGLAGNDRLHGGDGNDTLLSGGAVPEFFGLDILEGGAGDDILVSQGGVSYLIGGPGNDTFLTTTEFAGDQWFDWAQPFYETSPTAIYANLTGVSITDTIGGTTVTLDPGEIWDGFGSIDTFGMFDGTNIVNGVPVFRDSTHDDQIFVDGSYRIDNFWGNWIEVRLSEGNDFVDFTGVTGTSRISWQAAGGGVNVSLSIDPLTGLSNGTATDAIAGDNFIGTDTFINANSLRGSRYDDVLTGDSNDTRFRGSKGNDTIDGAGGTDLIEHFDSPDGIIVDLSLATGQVIDDGFGTTDNVTGIENVRGSWFDDTITGDAAANLLLGHFGSDTLSGGGGNDFLRGGFGSFDGLFDGDDILDGGTGNDTLQGGGGNDLFVFRPGDGFDVINDFRLSEGDQIDVGAYGLSSTADFNSLTFTGTNIIINFNGIDAVTVLNLDPATVADPESLFVFTSQTIQILQLQPGDFDSVFDGAFFDLDVDGDIIGFDVSVTGVTSPTSFTIVNNFDTNRTTTFDGTGLTYDGLGNPAGGTINAITFTGSATTTPVTLATATGLSVPTVDLISAFASAPFDGTAALGAIFDQYNLDYTGSGGADFFQGSDVNDILRGGDGDDELAGDDGNDSYIGGGGADTYLWAIDSNNVDDGGAGYDNVDGAGDDNRMDIIQIEGTNHFDLNWGWDGANFFVGVAVDSNYRWVDVGGNVRINDFRATGGSVAYFEADTQFNDFYSADNSVSRVYLTNGITGINQGIYTEIVLGTENADVMTTGGGFRDYLYGDGGDDIIMGSDTTISDLRGGDGNDQLLGASNVDRLAGGAGDDLLDGGGGVDLARYDRDSGPDGAFVNLSAVAVTLMFEGVLETVNAGQAIDTWNDTDTLVSIENFSGSAQGDIVIGSDADNFLDGRGGNDTINGNAGEDFLNGREGDDIINGGDDNDGLVGAEGSNQLDGGAGFDYALYRDHASSIDAVRDDFGNGTVVHSSGTDTLTNIEGIEGSEFDDTITGGIQNDTFFARGGNDILSGGGGSDFLVGEAGNDIIIGGGGSDNLTGGTGADTFVTDALDVGIGDIIADYDILEGDIVDLTALFEVDGDGSTPTVDDDSVSDFARIDPLDSTKLQVDTDGLGTAQTWQDVATLDTSGGVNILYNEDGTDTPGVV